MVHFVGAGPGAEDLITLRGARLLQEADVIIYAGSLVSPALLSGRKPGVEVYDSAVMTLEQIVSVMKDAEKQGKTTVRLHTGDPSIYGAVREQMDLLDEAGIAYDVTPGVSSFTAAAAAMNLEFTLPEVSQTVIVTRMAGRTPVPERESIEKLASHGAGMAVFLSAGMTERLSEALIRGGYPPETPAAIIYRASWPEERCLPCTVGTLAATAAANGITRHAMILAGDFVGHRGYARSRLYDPAFTTGYRQGTEEAEMQTAPEAPVTAAEPEVQAAPETQAASTVPETQKKTEVSRKEIAVVGMGPGKEAGMTLEALEALEAADVIVGYPVYLELLGERFRSKRMLSTPMRKERERCRMAFEAAADGSRVAMLCSGDAGVYGMASLMFEVGEEFPEIPVRVIPGVTAALSGAALLGAPLGTDFCVISLSDLLTPWEKIEARLRAAAEGDLCIAIYNPSSRKRADHLRRACGILLETLPPDRVCGLVRNIGREGESMKILTLEELRDTETDMFTTVFVGNSSSECIGGHFVTKRGYRET